MKFEKSMKSFSFPTLHFNIIIINICGGRGGGGGG